MNICQMKSYSELLFLYIKLLPQQRRTLIYRHQILKMRANVNELKKQLPDIEVLEGEEEWVIKVIDLPNTDSEAVISKTSPKNLPLESDD